MPPTEDQRRLLAVAERFEGLLSTDPRCRHRAEAGARRYRELAEEHRRGVTSAKAARRAKLRQVLGVGLLVEPKSAEGGAGTIEWVRGLFPKVLMSKLWFRPIAADSSLSEAEVGLGATCDVELGRRVAAAALKEVDWQDRLRDSGGPARERLHRRWTKGHRDGTHMEGTIGVTFYLPADAQNVPPHPETLRWSELMSLPRADRVSIAYARLAGLQSARSADPVIQKPPELDIGNPESIRAYVDHQSLVPAEESDGKGPPALDPARLEPDLAESLLRMVETDLVDSSARTYTLEEALAVLAHYPSWRLPELPSALSADILRVLDADGLIEVRPWVLQNPTTDSRNPQPLVPQPWSHGWCSPVAKPELAGTWDQVFVTAGADPRIAVELRVSERGRAEHTRRSLRMRETAPPPTPPHDPASPSLRDEHLTILVELAARDVPVKAAALDGTSGMPPYDRLLDLLKELEDWGFLSRPHGPKSGYMIRPEGRDELRRRGLLD